MGVRTCFDVVVKPRGSVEVTASDDSGTVTVRIHGGDGDAASLELTGDDLRDLIRVLDTAQEYIGEDD